MSDSDHWCSPPEIAGPLKEFFGGPVGCDPCSNSTSIIRAKRVYTIGGLHLPWGSGRKGDDSSYWNCPYSATAPWVVKSQTELDAERIRETIALIMCVPSTAWWRQACAYPRMNPRIIITKRLCFIDPKAPRKGTRRTNARFDTALFFYGGRAPRMRAFDKTFAGVASWSTWGRL